MTIERPAEPWNEPRPGNDPSGLPGPLGKYQPLVELGSGGMARVYLAVARGPSGFSKLVVLKVLRHDLAGDPEFRTMFLNEARLSARLNHPNVVQTYEIVEQERGPLLVMEYLEGESLNHIRERDPDGTALSLAMRLAIVSDLLSGLHHAHELCDFDGSPLDLVHRDVSPHNVHVTFDGQVKVLDFGIARVKGMSSQTATGVIRGKVRYMAPEQMMGEPVDRRADIFAAGAVLWELVTNTQLWKHTPDIETMNRVLNEGVPQASTVRPDVLPSLDAILAKALSREPDERYADCLAFQADIEGVIDAIGGRVLGREIGKAVAEMFADARVDRRLGIERLLATSRVSDAGLPPPAAEAKPSSPTRRRGRVAAVAVAALVAVLFAGLVGRPKATAEPRAQGDASAASSTAPGPTLSPSSAAQVDAPAALAHPTDSAVLGGAAPQAPVSPPRPVPVVAIRRVSAVAPPPAATVAPATPLPQAPRPLDKTLPWGP